jgi:hypothetical protein
MRHLYSEPMIGSHRLSGLLSSKQPSTRRMVSRETTLAPAVHTLRFQFPGPESPSPTGRGSAFVHVPEARCGRAASRGALVSWRRRQTLPTPAQRSFSTHTVVRPHQFRVPEPGAKIRRGLTAAGRAFSSCTGTSGDARRCLGSLEDRRNTEACGGPHRRLGAPHGGE